MDLDGDGYLDLISGSWPGELFFFKGGPNGTFAPPIKIKDKNGQTINIGGGRRPDSGDMILIAGDATFEKTEKGYVILYDGQRIEIPEGKQAGITGTASAVYAVDWRSRGVYDLLVGDIGGNVWLVPNDTESIPHGPPARTCSLRRDWPGGPCGIDLRWTEPLRGERRGGYGVSMTAAVSCAAL